MGVASTVTTSRRGYLSQSELAQFSDITITNTTEADEKIRQAEEVIDSFVGPQCKFIQDPITGLAASGGAANITLEVSQQNGYDVDYFKWCEIEIIGGTCAGQRRKVTSSTKEGVLMVDSAWTGTPDNTSFYKIYQLGRFPRNVDVVGYSTVSPVTYYKSIPEAVKRAVAAQVEFMIEMGDGYFSGDKTDKEAESIGDYSYQLAQGAAGVNKLIGPKARMLLRGIINRTGVITTN
jgi:hypothetical protein